MIQSGAVATEVAVHTGAAAGQWLEQSRGCPPDPALRPLTLQISGIGKFPYLSLEQSSLDLGSVLVGKSVEHLLKFGNHSVVNANFTVVHAEGAEDGVFVVTPAK